jgi:hypothetical protein
MGLGGGGTEYTGIMITCKLTINMKTVKPTRCYTMVYWTLWITQHVSGITMPIIRSLWLYRRPQRMAPHLGYGRLLIWCMAVGLSVQLEGCCTSRWIQYVFLTSMFFLPVYINYCSFVVDAFKINIWLANSEVLLKINVQRLVFKFLYRC